MARLFMIWLLLISVAGYGVYHLKYEVRKLENQLTKLNRQILEDQEEIHALKAEWTHLNQPKMLEAAAVTHLQMEPIRGRQFATVDIVPMRGKARQWEGLGREHWGRTDQRPLEDESGTTGAPDLEDEGPANLQRERAPAAASAAQSEQSLLMVRNNQARVRLSMGQGAPR